MARSCITAVACASGISTAKSTSIARARAGLYLGYCNQEIWGTVNEHAQCLTHVHQGFDTLPRFALARRITQFARPLA